ncbi:hypothetical protein GL263_13945 [Streptomyces durbertensis]|uniref:DUF7224 domain-containing protein n=1 Tax=Streptomyces durbertensis TaxID=2448886 RepID=A0ABR6EH54_9ACTN|nr:hypothetical protein [Streptomyces durbertensis]MBB1244659.1 hypothetical protein [Streptomyces durbertensis]
MRLWTRLRASSALWAAVPLLLVMLFYYVVHTYDAVTWVPYGHPPAVVADALEPVYLLSLTAVAALAAWEGGKLRQWGVWGLAPARNRFAVATQALWPVLAVTWLAIVLPVTASLIQAGTVPSWHIAPHMLMALVVPVAYAVIGFAVGLVLRPTISAPLLGVTVFLVPGFSVTMTSFAPRHMFGRGADAVILGEYIPFSSVFPAILLACGTAAALCLLWVPRLHIALRVVTACAIVAACTLTSYRLVADWDSSVPVKAGITPLVCEGRSPEVCVPEGAADRLPAIHKETSAVVEEMHRAGLVAVPRAVTDSAVSDRGGERESAALWRHPLTYYHEQGKLRHKLIMSAIHESFPCPNPGGDQRRALRLWAAGTVGEGERLLDRYTRSDSFGPARTDKLRQQVEKVRELPPDEQLRWYHDGLKQSCAKGVAREAEGL